MADKNKNNASESEEKKKKLQERKEREERERKELEQKQKDKVKKQKARELRVKKREAAERKRIKELVKFPFKALFQGSFLISFLSFIFMFFGIKLELQRAVFNAFFIFTAFYLGFGVVIVGFTYVVSERKKKELEEQKRIEEERKMEEERERLEKQEKLREEIKEAELKREEELQKFRERMDIKDNQPLASAALGAELGEIPSGLPDEIIGAPKENLNLEDFFKPEETIPAGVGLGQFDEEDFI